MDLAFRRKEDVWRGRGRPRRAIEPQVVQAAQQTYRTGRVGEATYTAEEEEEARELIAQLNAYARSVGKRMVIQRGDADEILFQMVDYVRKAKK